MELLLLREGLVLPARRLIPLIGFSTKWVKQRARRVGIASEAQWAGRVLVISPATVPSLHLGVEGPWAGQGCSAFAAASSTRHHWIAVEHEDQRFAGTFRLVPVCAGDGSLSLGQAGGGPRSRPKRGTASAACGSRSCAGGVVAWARAVSVAFQRLLRYGVGSAWGHRRKAVLKCNSIRTAMPTGNGITNRICGILRMPVSVRRMGPRSILMAPRIALRRLWALRFAFPISGLRSGPEAHRQMRKVSVTSMRGSSTMARARPSPRFPKSWVVHASPSEGNACGSMLSRRRTWWGRAGAPGLYAPPIYRLKGAVSGSWRVSPRPGRGVMLLKRELRRKL